jgi:hypothetical protein
MKNKEENDQDTRMDTKVDPIDSRTASEDTVLSPSVSPTQVSNEPDMQTEYFIVATSFAAPFVSDDTTSFETALTPASALTQFAKRYKHPAGLYAALAYASATAYHKGAEPLARWLSNHAAKIESAKPTMVLVHGPGCMELDGKAVTVKNPKDGSVRRG